MFFSLLFPGEPSLTMCPSPRNDTFHLLPLSSPVFSLNCYSPSLLDGPSVVFLVSTFFSQFCFALLAWWSARKEREWERRDTRFKIKFSQVEQLRLSQSNCLTDWGSLQAHFAVDSLRERTHKNINSERQTRTTTAAQCR